MPPRVKGYKATVLDGIKFASKKEAKRYAELRFLEQAGEIRNLARQVKFALHGKDGPILTPTGRVMTYVADFTYFDNSSDEVIVEDAKGWKTDTYKIKKAIMAAQGIDIKEV